MTTKEMIHALLRQGWRCERGRRGGHWKCYPPGSRLAIPMPCTPSDKRAWLNARARLRRAGAEL